VKWIGSDDPTLINDDRFAPAGVLAPKSKADIAFVLHALSYLSSKGRAAIVCFPGIFYRGGAEQKIRQYLVDNNYVETVICARAQPVLWHHHCREHFGAVQTQDRHHHPVC
jgi:type I restriction enzyme M protein